MKNKIEIPAIHDKNLMKILTDLGLLDKINNKQLLCSNCGETITLENIAGIKILKNAFVVICDNPECIFQESNGMINGE